MSKINKNQEVFIEEYMLHGNASEAYEKAYPGVKRTSAATNGERMLRNADIQAIIESKRNQLVKKYDITKDFLINELLDLIKSCKQDERMDRNNWNKAIQTLAKITGHDIQKIEIQDNTTRISIITDRFEDVDYEEIENKKITENDKIQYKLDGKTKND